jgi:DNA-binding MarR family transcriptional regulator
MTTRVKTEATTPLEPTALAAWRNFVAVNARLLRELDEEMRAEHGCALGDYDVLVQLSRASPPGLRMCDLASAVLLSPSGLSRRVERLERSGLVERSRSEGDARSIEARLTPSGRRLVRRLSASHLAAVKTRFADHFAKAELATLAELLGRLEGARSS